MVSLGINVFDLAWIWACGVLAVSAFVDLVHNCKPDCRGCRPWPSVLLEPDPNCTTYFESNPDLGASLGHAFMNYLSMLSMCIELGLTMRRSFGCVPHNHALEIPYFFGAHFTHPVAANCPTKPLEGQKPSQWLPQVAKHRESCQAGTAGCIRFTYKRASLRDRGLNVGMLRSVFEAQEPARRKLPVAWPSTEAAELTVAVHVRRGDAIRDKNRGSRSVPNRGYLGLLAALLPVLQREGRGAPLHVVIHTQNAANTSAVLDWDGRSTDYAAALRRHAGVRVSLGPADVLASFSGLCNADVVITSKSGFSYMAAVLCRRPVFLTVPFWHSYHCVPNALPVTVAPDHVYNFSEALLLRLMTAAGPRG